MLSGFVVTRERAEVPESALRCPASAPRVNEPRGLPAYRGEECRKWIYGVGSPRARGEGCSRVSRQEEEDVGAGWELRNWAVRRGRGCGS